jgi:prolyl oligopeptidase PreP (S9A serine peptidase family)
LDGKADVSLDPNGLSEDGTVALCTYVISEDAKYLVYSLSSSGSDWVTVKVMWNDDKKVEPDTLSWVSDRFSYFSFEVQCCNKWMTDLLCDRLNFRVLVGQMIIKVFSTAATLLQSKCKMT